jgi:myosin heavy subunit
MHVSELLGVPYDELTDALLTNVISTAGETFVRRNTVTQSSDARDAMAKVHPALLLASRVVIHLIV